MAQRVVFAGIDVSKHQLDVALWPDAGPRLRVARDASGLAEMVAWLGQQGVARVGLEATGGYEREVIAALEAAGCCVDLHNALRVRRFAQAMGRLAKNDRADAAMIARFTAAYSATARMASCCLIQECSRSWERCLIKNVPERMLRRRHDGVCPAVPSSDERQECRSCSGERQPLAASMPDHRLGAAVKPRSREAVRRRRRA